MIKCVNRLRDYFCLTGWLCDYECEQNRTCSQCSEFSQASDISDDLFKEIDKLINILVNKGKECKKQKQKEEELKDECN